MATLLELTASLVSAHVSKSQMTSDEMLQELNSVFNALKALEAGTQVEGQQVEPVKQLTVKQAFKKDEVICMVCGKGFKTLKRHLAQAHDLKPGQYRKQFGIPATQSLAAKSYSESRRKMAEERGLGDVLAKAREKRAAGKKAAEPAKSAKTSAPAVKAKATAPQTISNAVKAAKASAAKKK